MKRFKHIVVLCSCTLFNVLSHAAIDQNVCGESEQAQQLVQLIKNDPEQQRDTLRCNPILVEAAKQKVMRMLEWGMVRHNLGGSPNSHLRDLGYKLPRYYGGAFSNQVEALAGGFKDAEQVWKAFKSSEEHRQHLLGEVDFYREQDEIGVAFVKEWDSPHVEYWVVYITKGYEPDQKVKFEESELPNKSSVMLNKE